MNVPAVLGLSRLIRNRSLCLPHYTVPTFDELPFPLNKAFENASPSDGRLVDLRAVVLDKDNCFATAHSNEIHKSCQTRFQQLIDEFSPSGVLIVSNSSGLSSKDPDGTHARTLEANTGVPVLRHLQPKPACGSEIMEHFKDRVTSPAQVVVIGDRLLTDTALAHRMGARSIWIRRGVVTDRGPVTQFEHWLYDRTLAKGYTPPRVAE